MNVLVVDVGGTHVNTRATGQMELREFPPVRKHRIGKNFYGLRQGCPASIFVFILFANCLSLIPGIGTIGRGHAMARAFKIDQPLFRGANADVNLTLATAAGFPRLLDLLSSS